MATSLAPGVSFKARMLQVREDAIIHAVNRLLAEKGFDAMTVDEVAARVGIAKASLYKHFPSKEDLAATAMVHVMRRAQEFSGGERVHIHEALQGGIRLPSSSPSNTSLTTW